MKMKVRINIPCFITEVDVSNLGDFVVKSDQQEYAHNVALERFADKMREGESWFDSGSLDVDIIEDSDES